MAVKYVNHNIFDQYSHESAYWAGFIAADGSIKANKKGYKK